MANEIERKYLLLSDAWTALPVTHTHEIKQGYIPDAGVDVHMTFPKPDTVDIRITKGQDIVRLSASGKHIKDDFAKVAELPEFDNETGQLHIRNFVMCRLRSRQTDGQKTEAFLTIKAPTGRADILKEFETEVAYDEAVYILQNMSAHSVEKTRNVIPHGGNVWEVDVFHRKLEGLTLAELEAEDVTVFDNMVALPDLGQDVTALGEYANRALGEFGIPEHYRTLKMK